MLVLARPKLEKIQLCPSSPIKQVIANLESGTEGICLVALEQSNILFGTITDGDVRRYLLNKGNLEGYAKDIANINPISAPLGFDHEQYKAICQVNGIRQLPLLSKDQKINGLFLLYSETQRIEDCRLIVMAGGKGKRLKPYTDSCPKPMLKIGGKPIIEHIITKAKNEGIGKVSISVNYLKEVIRNHIGDGTKLGVEVTYIEETEPLGTAGSLSSLNVKEGTIIVTNGDILTDVNYMDIVAFHNANGAVGTMAVKEHEIANPYGVVKTKGIDLVGFQEKPIYKSYVNTGIYVLKTECTKLIIHDQYCDMPTVFERLRETSKKTIVYPIHEPWIDIGRPAELRTMQNSKKQKKE